MVFTNEEIGPLHLMPSKTYLPQPRKAEVSRDHLLARMQAGEPGLVLVTAPAGFGKTTLLALWAQIQQTQPAWLQLDSRDNHLRRFGTCLIAALQTRRPQLGVSLINALASAQEASLPKLLVQLVHELHGLQQPLCLVLDDYHLIKDEAIHELLVFLLENRPPLLRLLIASRAAPPFPLARWRVRAQLVELGSEELRFKAEETQSFLVKTMGLRCSDDDSHTLHQRTEGWVAGLQLAGLSLKGGAIAETINRFQGDHHLVFDYLTEEVLAHEEAHVRHFLLTLSIPKRFNAELCRHLTQETDSEGLLAYLNNAHLFLVPLDSENRWFRFHHLFGTILHRHLVRQVTPLELKALHLKASEWWEQHGDIDHALYHAHEAGDAQMAAALIARHAMSTLLAGSPIRVINWLESLPQDLIVSSARLNLDMIWCMVASLHTGPEMIRYIQQADTALEHQPDPVQRAELTVIRGVALGLTGHHAQAIAEIEKAFTHLDETHYARGIGLVHLGLNCFYLDLFQQGAAYLERASRLNRRLASHALWFIADLLTTHWHFKAGRFTLGHDLLKVLAKEVEDHPRRFNPDSPGLVQVSLAAFYWDQNETEPVPALMQEALLLAKHLELPGLLYTAHGVLAWMAICERRYAEAMAEVNHLAAVAERFQHQRWNETIDCLRASVWLGMCHHSGNAAARDALEAWITDSQLTTSWREQHSQLLAPHHSIDFRQTILARFYLLKNRTDKALVVLDWLARKAEDAGRCGDLIGVRVLTALALDKAGRREEAVTVLEKAVLAAEPEGYLRVFLQEGKPLMALISHAHKVHPQPFYERLLKQLAPSAAASASVTGVGSLVEPLSARETEVLGMIARGLSNREAADALFLAPATVKKHLENIYGKLDVNKRTQAVARARDLGLI